MPSISLYRYFADLISSLRHAQPPPPTRVVVLLIRKTTDFCRVWHGSLTGEVAAYVCRGVEVKSCNYFNSNTFPLKIVLNSAEDDGGLIQIIYKVRFRVNLDLGLVDKVWVKVRLDLGQVDRGWAKVWWVIVQFEWRSDWVKIRFGFISGWVKL